MATLISERQHPQAIWRDYQGDGVAVGIWDDGVQRTHWDLSANYDANKQVTIKGTLNNGQPLTNSDAHGTSVAGLIAADNNGQGGVGIAHDARITAIYEGTNGIQAMDLVGRKLPMRAGGVMDDYLTQIGSLVARLDAAGSEFAGMRDRIDESLACVRNTVMWLTEHGIADVRNALAGATPFLRMFGLLRD